MAQNYRKREQISRSDNSSDISSFFFFFLVNVKFTEKFRLSAFTKKLKNFFHVRHVCVLFVFLFRSPQKGQGGFLLLMIVRVTFYRIIRWIVTFDNLGATLV